jgi:hypothetical protein
MTLRDLLQYAENDPKLILAYFLFWPMLSFLLFALIKDSNKAYRINWLFSIICFLVVLPGIFTLNLNIYLFLFERQSIWDLNLVTQVLPIVSMITSLFFVKKTLAFDYIPGFEKLSSISALIFGIMALLWVVDKTHIFAFSMIPFSVIIIGFVALILLVKFGFKRLF